MRHTADQGKVRVIFSDLQRHSDSLVVFSVAIAFVQHAIVASGAGS